MEPCPQCGGTHAPLGPCPGAQPAGAHALPTNPGLNFVELLGPELLQPETAARISNLETRPSVALQALPIQENMPLPGTLVAGRFEIAEKLGAGGMGFVFTARHIGLDRLVCLKMPRVALVEAGERERLIERFRVEARAASRIRHPNVIQVIDAGDDPVVGPYYAMELVSGTTLDALLVKEYPLGEERTCRLVAQLLSGLGAAHASQVVHRDLKPSNVMIERLPDGSEQVKVVDFGIARLLDSPNQSKAGLVSGTASYMSPEQATGSKVDARADLYAVGGILYELLTRTVPFQGDAAGEVMHRQAHELPEPPSVRSPDIAISDAMERVIMRALEKDPANRPQTAEEFRTELLRIADHVRSVRDAARRASDATRRMKEADALQARVAVLRADPAAPAPSKDDAWATVEKPAARPAQASSKGPVLLVVAGALAALAIVVFGLSHKGAPAAPAVVAPPVVAAPAPVTLRVTTTPAGAELLLDGTSLGHSPLELSRAFPPGAHALVAKLAGYDDASSSVTLEKPQDLALALTATAPVAVAPVAVAPRQAPAPHVVPAPVPKAPPQVAPAAAPAKAAAPGEDPYHLEDLKNPYE